MNMYKWHRIQFLFKMCIYVCVYVHAHKVIIKYSKMWLSLGGGVMG